MTMTRNRIYIEAVSRKQLIIMIQKLEKENLELRQRINEYSDMIIRLIEKARTESKAKLK